MSNESAERRHLRRAVPLGTKRWQVKPSTFAVTLQNGGRTLGLDEVDRLVEATPGQGDMPRIEFGAGSDPGLAESRQPHGLRARIPGSGTLQTCRLAL